MNISSLTQNLSQYLSNQDLSRGQTQSDPQHGKVLSSQASVSVNQSVQISQNLSPEERQQTALQVVNDTLSKAYEHMRSHSLSVTDQYQAFEPLTAEKVASNVLGFIERRLRLDQADGATQEQLNSRLEAGLSGFKKGFAEAQDKLKSLDLLSNNVAQDIGKTYDLVIKGIDDLRQKYLGDKYQGDKYQGDKSQGDSGAQADVSDSALNTATKPIANQPATTSTTPDSLIQTAAKFESFTQLGAARARDFSFELTTRDGDKVKINASASQALGLAYGKGTNNQELAGSYSASQSFSLSVEGDLNADELGAINDLLSKVNDLADQFYAGNLDEAWNQAQALGFDDQQITGYTLGLSQVEVQLVNRDQSATAATGADAATDNSPLSQLSGLDSVHQFMKSLLDALDSASSFAQPGQLLESLAAGLDQYLGQGDAQGKPEEIRQSADAAQNANHHRFYGFLQARLGDIASSK